MYQHIGGEEVRQMIQDFGPGETDGDSHPVGKLRGAGLILKEVKLLVSGGLDFEVLIGVGSHSRESTRKPSQGQHSRSHLHGCYQASMQRNCMTSSLSCW